MDGALRRALVRLAGRLEVRLGELRGRGRTPRIDRLGGLAIEAGDAEGLIAELSREEDPARGHELVSEGVAACEHAARCFQLTPFETDVLLLALAPEIDARFCRLFGFLNDSVVAFRPTVGLAVATLAIDTASGYAAFLPEGRLARFGLVTTEGDGPLAGRAIRVAPDVWPRLAGFRAPRSRARTRQASNAPPMTSAAIAAAVHAIRAGSRPLLVVTGARPHVVLHALGEALGSCVALRATAATDRELRRAAMRDALWDGVPLVVEDEIPNEALEDLVGERSISIAAVVSPRQLAPLLATTDRLVLELASDALDRDELAERWRGHGCEQIGLDAIELVHRFRFDADRIAAVMKLARARSAARGEEVARDDVLGACRTLSGAGTSKLAHKLETAFESDDLVVPHATRTELELFETAACRGHALFGRGMRGGEIRRTNGFIAMFAGPPGTGKTMAAQIVARRLDVELLRIDLSQVVDKYIGETEKHLDVIFGEAETSGALLFFDEADALFGKRTEVKNAHDRYSNIETAFLLQRLEQHPGIAVLATNLSQNLDAAFIRRLHFMIEFPLPGPGERRDIWERHLVRGALDMDVDLDFLARFELSGGDIRNAAVGAVLLSEKESRIGMRHLVVAISRELRKAGRLAQPEQFGSWQDAIVGYYRNVRAPAARPVGRSVVRR